jgi:peptide deformylase
MPVRDIVILGDDVLRREAEPIPPEAIDDDLRDLVEDMFATMYHADGIGLAAPQIGISRRVLVIDLRREDEEEGESRIALVNPRIVESSKDVDRAPEGCLSIPGMEEVVERPWSVVVEALDPDGNEVRIEADDLMARALQHEVDHLDGILFFDRISPLKRKLFMKKWRKSREEAEAR